MHPVADLEKLEPCVRNVLLDFSSTVVARTGEKNSGVSPRQALEDALAAASHETLISLMNAYGQPVGGITREGGGVSVVRCSYCYARTLMIYNAVESGGGGSDVNISASFCASCGNKSYSSSPNFSDYAY